MYKRCDNGYSEGVTAGPEATSTRRERVRAATQAEIKQRAWAQIARGGADALSLRSLARDMGMTGSAIYRYYAGRDELLLALMQDAFASLADALEAAEVDSLEAGQGGTDEHWMVIARAYRNWARGHPSEYGLIFGKRLNLDHEAGPVGPEHRRGVAVLFRAMVGCVASGRVDLSALDASVSPELRRQLEGWKAAEGIDLPIAALAGCMTCWSQLHGMLMLELFGGFPPQLVPLDALFDQQMRYLMVRMGVRTG